MPRKKPDPDKPKPLPRPKTLPADGTYHTTDEETKDIIFELLAAGFRDIEIYRYIMNPLNKTAEGKAYSKMSYENIGQYRRTHADAINELRIKRHDGAMNKGLSIADERVARLEALANRLEGILFVADEKGKLWNIKTYLETLDAIAQEVGGRKRKVTHGVDEEIGKYIARITEYVENSVDPTRPDSETEE